MPGPVPRPRVAPVPVARLAGLLGLRTPDSAVDVTGVGLDSRAVLPGDLYAALPGGRTHGADFARQALEHGAVALLTDPDGAGRLPGTAAPVLVVDHPRARLGDVAAEVYGRPAERLLLVGVTGTNGKTTTTYLVESGLRAAGHVTGLVGTVQTQVAGEVLTSVRTTPEAPDLQALFALMVERGCTAAALEVSSHALALGRADGYVHDVAVFTNLSQDHLDFHATMEDYYQAKAALFTPSHARAGVVVVDDPAGRRLAIEAGVPAVTAAAIATGADADWTVEDVRLRSDGSDFVVLGPDGLRAAAAVGLPGRFNVANALAALAALATAGVPLPEAVEGVAAVRSVPGRMERVDAGQPFLAVVDYAHTPHAVRTLLASVRPLAAPGGRVIVVLGCGGERDAAKRPLMGAEAARGADVVVLTDDNPRGEDPAVILDAMLDGARHVADQRVRVVVEPERAAAIRLAVAEAAAGDVVVVAGKGHETGQEVAGRVLPFDDRDVLRAAVRDLGAGT